MIDEFSATRPRNCSICWRLTSMTRTGPRRSSAVSLSAFGKHQPQYLPEACLVVSGSNRTALGILGFHCDITEVVIPDLSWSYEQCFPKVHAVPLTASLGLDVNAIIEKVEQLCQQDPSWRSGGALALTIPITPPAGFLTKHPSAN